MKLGLVLVTLCAFLAVLLVQSAPAIQAAPGLALAQIPPEARQVSIRGTSASQRGQAPSS